MLDIAIFMMGIAVGVVIGYPFGLFINKLDKRYKDGGR
jgi:predicted MFS family arabinose efflux permease